MAIIAKEHSKLTLQTTPRTPDKAFKKLTSKAEKADSSHSRQS